MSRTSPSRPPPAETGSAALPALVETAACAVAVGGDLLLLVNRPGPGTTELLRVHPSGAAEPLPALPLLASGAAACGDGLIVAGAAADGSMLALGVAAGGEVRWRAILPGAGPTRWPVPGCAPRPTLAWQTSPAALEVAEAGPRGIGRAWSLRVGGPPLDVAVGGGAVWAAWTEPSEVRVAVARAEGTETLHLPARFASDVAAAAWEGGAAVAWTEGSGAFLARLAGRTAEAPAVLELGPAAGGTLAVVAGPQPAVWAQRVETREGEEPGSVAALVLPGRAPALLHEPVFAVAWWGRRLAVVCPGAVRCFELEAA